MLSKYLLMSHWLKLYLKALIFHLRASLELQPYKNPDELPIFSGNMQVGKEAGSQAVALCLVCRLDSFQ